MSGPPGGQNLLVLLWSIEDRTSWEMPTSIFICNHLPRRGKFTRPVIYETVFHPVGPSWIALKSFVCNLNLHYYILEQLSIKLGFPCGLNNSTKNSVILLVIIDCALSCTEFSFLTVDS